MKSRNFTTTRVYLVLGTVLLTGLACRWGLKGPEKPGDPIPVSTEAAGEFEAEIHQAMEIAQSGGIVEVSFTEEELTSFLAFKLHEQDEIQFIDPQVYLRDDKVQFFGTFQSGSLQLPLRIVFLPRIDDAGNVRLELETVDMGSITAPDSLIDRIQNEVSQSYNQILRQAEDEFFVESVSIRDGTMTLRGKKR